MKTAALFVFLCLVPPAFCQSASPPQPSAAKTQEKSSKSEAKISPEKEAAIRKLFEIQGTRKNMEQVIAGISGNMKPTLAKMLPPGEYQEKLISLFFDRFQTKLKTNDLVDLLIPIYDKYYTKEDIEALAQFYQTPLGKKLISVLPQVAVETQTAAMHMGEEVGRQSMMEVLAEHPDLAKAMQEASSPKN